MPNQNNCPKCGSSELIPDVTVMTHIAEGNSAVMAEVERRPGALFLKDPFRTPLMATVCAQCGFAEFYATDARELLSAYRASQSSREGG